MGCLFSWARSERNIFNLLTHIIVVQVPTASCRVFAFLALTNQPTSQPKDGKIVHTCAAPSTFLYFLVVVSPLLCCAVLYCSTSRARTVTWMAVFSTWKPRNARALNMSSEQACREAGGRGGGGKVGGWICERGAVRFLRCACGTHQARQHDGCTFRGGVLKVGRIVCEVYVL